MEEELCKSGRMMWEELREQGDKGWPKASQALSTAAEGGWALAEAADAFPAHCPLYPLGALCELECGAPSS